VISTIGMPPKPVSSAGDEVERPGPKRAERDPRFSRQPPIGGCQESCRLLMTGDDELDRGPPKAFDDIEVLLTGHPEDSIDALVLEGGNEKIRSLHVRSPLYIQEPEKFHLVKSRLTLTKFSLFGRELQARADGNGGRAMPPLQIACSEMS